MKKAALTQAINEAWMLLAVLTFAALGALVFVRSRVFAGGVDASPRAVNADA